MHPLAKFTPCGAQTLSKMACRYPANYPAILARGQGPWVYDDQGHKYLDLIAGLGAVSIGYADPRVNHAIESQLEKGCSFSLPTEIEFKAAKLLTELVPGTDQWKFGKNGTDGTVMAVRAARALTGRSKIMTVGYNGCADVFECRGTRRAGIPYNLAGFNTRAIYNDIGSFWDLITGEYACVLLEARVFEAPKAFFLEELRIFCTETKTLLILDEVVNGGRYNGFTSASNYKIVPDLYVLGKGLANGLPLCAVGGSRQLMSVFERDDFFASGTFGGETVALAAFLETALILMSTIKCRVIQGIAIQDEFDRRFKGIAEAIGYPTRLDFRFKDPSRRWVFWQEMLKKGIMCGYTNFVMASLDVNDTDRICEAIKDVRKGFEDKILEGPEPVGAIRT